VRLIADDEQGRFGAPVLFFIHRTDRSPMPEKTHAASLFGCAGARPRSNSLGDWYDSDECIRLSL